MAGLGPTTMENTPMRSDGMASGAPQPDMAQEGEEAANVSPEEQQQYDAFVDNAYNLVFDEKMLPGVLKSLEGNGDPKEGLANVTAMVVLHLEESAMKSGKQISPDVLLQGGAEILESLAETAEAAKIHDYSEADLEGATYRALDIYRELRAGNLDKGAIQQDFAAILNADKDGTLGEMVPGLKEKFGGAEQQPKGSGLGQGMG